MYMDNKGFLLMSAIFSLFLLGLVAVTCLPILSTALNNFSLADTKGNMICTAETIIEKVKSYDGDLNSEEIIFDISLERLIETLEESEQVYISLPLNPTTKEYKYICNIYKKEIDNLWEVKVNVNSIEETKGIKDVEITSLLPNPKRVRLNGE